jgi:hypothetical protein
MHALLKFKNQIVAIIEKFRRQLHAVNFQIAGYIALDGAAQIGINLICAVIWL